MALINIKQVHDGKAPNNASYSMALFTLALYCVSSILIAITLYQRPQTLVKNQMTKRCGYIYLNFAFEKPAKGRLASFFPVLTIGRILLLAVTIMFAGHFLVV